MYLICKTNAAGQTFSIYYWSCEFEFVIFLDRRLPFIDTRTAVDFYKEVYKTETTHGHDRRPFPCLLSLSLYRIVYRPSLVMNYPALCFYLFVLFCFQGRVGGGGAPITLDQGGFFFSYFLAVFSWSMFTYSYSEYVRSPYWLGISLLLITPWERLTWLIVVCWLPAGGRLYVSEHKFSIPIYNANNKSSQAQQQNKSKYIYYCFFFFLFVFIFYSKISFSRLK